MESELSHKNLSEVVYDLFTENLIGPLESVLFANGDPVTLTQLSDILQIDEQNVIELIEKLKQNLDERESGLSLIAVAGGYQLVTRAENFEYVERLSQTRDKQLSQAAMETLSIIAFKQPITKQEIEKIRGVRIERVMARLLELGLISEIGRKNVVGRPILYGTTEVFLQCFGLNDLKDLPPLPAPAEAREVDEQLSLLDSFGAEGETPEE